MPSPAARIQPECNVKLPELLHFAWPSLMVVPQKRTLKKRFQNKTKKTKRKRRRLSAASTTAELTEGITVNKNDNNSSVEEEFSHKKTFTAAWRWQHCSKLERKASVH